MISSRSLVQKTNIVVRVIHYLQERFPFTEGPLALSLTFAVPYIFLSQYFFEHLKSPSHLIVGTLTTVGFGLLMRVYDDLKDYEVDKVLFSERALPSGKVKISDLRIMVVCSWILLFVLNFAVQDRLTIYVFLGCSAYIALLSKWLFLESWIRPSLPLAFITHNPIVIAIQIYAWSFWYHEGESPGILLIFFIAQALPLSAWELGRKIRCPEDENNYTTYSKLFGWQPPAFAVTFLLLLACGFSVGSLYFLTASKGVLFLGALGLIPGYGLLRIYLDNKKQKFTSVFETLPAIYKLGSLGLLLVLAFAI